MLPAKADNFIGQFYLKTDKTAEILFSFDFLRQAVHGQNHAKYKPHFRQKLEDVWHGNCSARPPAIILYG